MALGGWPSGAGVDLVDPGSIIHLAAITSAGMVSVMKPMIIPWPVASSISIVRVGSPRIEHSPVGVVTPSRVSAPVGGPPAQVDGNAGTSPIGSPPGIIEAMHPGKITKGIMGPIESMNLPGIVSILLAVVSIGILLPAIILVPIMGFPAMLFFVIRLGGIAGCIINIVKETLILLGIGNPLRSQKDQADDEGDEFHGYDFIRCLYLVKLLLLLHLT